MGTQRSLAFQACVSVEFTDRVAEPGRFFINSCLQGSLFDRLEVLIDELQLATLKIQQLRSGRVPSNILQQILEERVRKSVTQCLKEVLQLNDFE